MGLLLRVLFWTSAFIIVWAMIGYPLSLRLIGRLLKSRTLKKDFNHQPAVTVMIVAHNEEKIISEKLNNVMELGGF